MKIVSTVELNPIFIRQYARCSLNPECKRRRERAKEEEDAIIRNRFSEYFLEREKCQIMIFFHLNGSQRIIYKICLALIFMCSNIFTAHWANPERTKIVSIKKKKIT